LEVVDEFIKIYDVSWNEEIKLRHISYDLLIPLLRALIIPQSKFIDVDNNRFVIKVPITIELLPDSIVYLKVSILAFNVLSLDS
jgi:hypothetical protein